MDILIREFHFYTDSRVVLGYICNNTRRSYTYVSKRLEKIRKTSVPEQWSYAHRNTTRLKKQRDHHQNRTLTDNTWLKGPTRWFTKLPEPADTTDSMLATWLSTGRFIIREVQKKSCGEEIEQLINEQPNKNWNTIDHELFHRLRRYITCWRPT